MPTADARVDPRILRSRELVLDAALVHFLAHGYPDANVETLATEAGVAKRTIYNLYRSKEDLFRAVIGWATDRAETFVRTHVPEPDPTRSVDQQLDVLAVAHASAVVTPRVVAIRRLLIGEAHRFPDLATEYFQRVPNVVIAAIGGVLEAHAASGALDIRDPRTSAEHFAYLVVGAPLDRALFLGIVPDADALEASARAGVAAFLRAYRPAVSPGATASVN